MPLQDSIQTISDSAQLALDSLQLRDSVLRADSIAMADSIAYADSVKLHAFNGYDGTITSTGASNQTWVFLLLLFLFAIIVISFIRSIIPPWQNITNYFSSNNRTSIFSKTSIDSFEQKIYFFTFSSLTIALIGYLLFCNQKSEFSAFTYSKYLGITLIFFAIKFILSKIIEFVFFDKNTMRLLIDGYLNMLTLVSAGLYLIAIIQVYAKFDGTQIINLTTLILLILGLLLFSIRLLQIFLHKFADSLYIMLYLCTLEILPVLLLIQVFRKIAINV